MADRANAARNRNRMQPQGTSKVSALRKLMSKDAFDVPFMMFTLALLTIGLIMLLSSSYTYAYYNDGDSTYYFKRQLIFAIVGVVLMFLVSKINYEWYKYLAIPGIAISIVLLVVVLFYHTNLGDFKRWIPLPGGFTFQPSEIAKVALVLFCAWSMEKHHRQIIDKTPSRGRTANFLRDKTNGLINPCKATSTLYMLFYAAVICLMCGLVFLENHLSGTILMFSIGVAMMFFGEVKMRWFVIGAVAVIAVVVFFVIFPDKLPSYAAKRITAWWDKDFDPFGARWQTNQSLYAIGSGGVLGAGLGNSKQKHLYVSEPQNDFIFSIVCEELGFIGATAIIILFGLLVWRGFVIAMKARDRFGALLAMGLVFQVGLQVALNIAVVTDTVPNTGISLPFFSYGGTSLMILLMEMGIVLSVSRYSRVRKM